MIDGEGSVYFQNRGLRVQRSIYVVNTDRDIILAVQDACLKLNIYYVMDTMRDASRFTLNRRPGWRVWFRTRSSLTRIYEEVPLQAVSKLDTLKKILKSYSQRPISRLPARRRAARNIEISNRTAAHYLAAIIDGEGYVAPRRNRLVITNTDDSILKSVKACLDKLGIVPYSFYNDGIDRYHASEIKRVVLYRKATLQKVLSKVPLRCTAKKRNLEAK